MEKSDEKIRLQLARFHRSRTGPCAYQLPTTDCWGTAVRPGLPFQTVAVPPMNMALLPDNLFATTARRLVDEISVAARYSTSLHHATANPECCQVLFDGHISEPVPLLPNSGDPMYGVTILSAVAEKMDTPKERFRIVGDTVSANLSKASQASNVRFTPMPHLLCSIARMRHQRGRIYYLSADLKTSFFQVLLPEHVRNAFVYRAPGGSLWRFTRLPMGYKLSVDIMQNIMESIKTELLRQLPQLADAIIDIYVDNILIAHDNLALLTLARSTLAAIAQTASVTIGEMAVSPDVIHRGVSLAQTTITLKPTFCAKLKRHIAVALSTSRLRQQQFLSLSGELTYADAILQATPVRMFYHLYHQITVSQSTPKVIIAPATKAELRSVLQWIDAQVPLHDWYFPLPLFDHLSNTSTAIELHFSDASRHWIGNVDTRLLPSTPEMSFHYSQTANTHDISQSSSASELHGMIAQAQRVMTTPTWSPHDLHFFAGDNTAAVRALARRFSSSLQLYNILKEEMHYYPRHATWMYIPGPKNPADWPSRNNFLALSPPTRLPLHQLTLAVDDLSSNSIFGRRRQMGVGGPSPVLVNNTG
jgi:hypothetical protein